MIADTRTNAGVDSISTYRKLHVVDRPGDRVLGVCTAGNLSVTQTALAMAKEGVTSERRREPRRWRRRRACSAAQILGPRPAQRAPVDRPGAAGGQPEHLGVDAAGRPDQGRRDGAVPDLQPGQFHRVRARHALSADRRAEIRQAHSGERPGVRHRPLRGGQAGADLVLDDHAQQCRGRGAVRHDHPPPRLPERRAAADPGRRSLFRRPARTLVGGAEDRAPRRSRGRDYGPRRSS